jgi:hypothetical protein
MKVSLKGVLIYTGVLILGIAALSVFWLHDVLFPPMHQEPYDNGVIVGYQITLEQNAKRIAELEKELQLAKDSVKEVIVTKIKYIEVHEPPKPPVIVGDDKYFNSERRGGVTLILHPDGTGEFWFKASESAKIFWSFGKDGKLLIASADPKVAIADKDGNYQKVYDENGQPYIPDLIISVEEAVKIPEKPKPYVAKWFAEYYYGTNNNHTGIIGKELFSWLQSGAGIEFTPATQNKPADFEFKIGIGLRF